MLDPITDRQALNVAMNALHTVINAAGIGPTDEVLRELHDNAQPIDSDLRAAYNILTHLCSSTPWNWKVKV